MPQVTPQTHPINPGRPGMRDARPILLLTRPRPQAERFARFCAEAIQPAPKTVISPILTIRPRKEDVDLTLFSAVILTSENAVNALADVAQVGGVTAFCVGDRTAQAARDCGMLAISAKGDADELVALVQQESFSGPVLHVHGAETAGNVADRLRAVGLSVHNKIIYDQVPTALKPEAMTLSWGDAPLVLPLFSPRSATLVAAGLTTARAPLILVALSAAVAKAWTGPKPAQIQIADRPDARHMRDIIAAHFPPGSA